MGAFSAYKYADDLGIDSRTIRRVTSWNETLSDELSKITGMDVNFITSTKAISKTNTVCKCSLKVTYLVLPPKANLFTGFQYIKWYVHRMIKKIDPDIVHGIGLEHIWPYIAVTSRYPSVITVHGIMSEIIKKIKTPTISQKRLFAYLERGILRKAKHLISISPYVQESLGRYTGATIYPVENPVANEFFSLNAKPSENKNILFVGEIQPWKDLLILIEAFAGLGENDIKLIIVGAATNSGYYKEVIDIINKLGIRERVIFKGFLLPNELKEEYKNAAFLVLPSIQETAPMCIAEAMAVGIPVIGTDVAGIPYMIQNGKSGLLFPVVDISRLEKHMKTLVENPQLRDEMGKQGKAVAESRWRPEIIARKTLDVYENILKDCNNK